MKYYFAPTRIAKSKIWITLPYAGKNVKKNGLSFIASWNAKWHSHFGIQFGSFFQN
jgi:hypothetical protein